MKSPHLSHHVGWLRLADINLCPWLVPGDLTRSTNSCCSSTCKSLEPRSRGTDLLRDRISDDEFKWVCGIISFWRLLAVSRSADSLLTSTRILYAQDMQNVYNLTAQTATTLDLHGPVTNYVATLTYRSMLSMNLNNTSKLNRQQSKYMTLPTSQY